MTGEQLKQELARIAEDAPHVDVPDDLFDRGRRATTRARVLVAAAAVACIALVVGIGAPLVLPDETPFADDDPPVGVPDVIYGPPLHDQSFGLPTTPLDEVGPATVSYQVEDMEGHVVLVTEDGEYRAVLLPNRWEPGLDEATPVLSPDGRRLAYASQRDLVRSLSVVDLTTGEVRDITLGPDPGALVHTLQWSPDGRSLVWSGQEVKEAKQSGGASYLQGTVAGVVGPGATRSRALPALPGNRWGGPGICDEGVALRFTGSTFRAHDGARVDEVASWPELVAAHGSCSAPHTVVPRAARRHGRLLGWLEGNPDDPATTAVVQRRGRLLLVWPGDARKQVGRIEIAWSKNLSVATGLMTADRPTVEAGPSPWERPWIVEHWLALLALLAVTAVTILVVVRARLVRR